MAYQIIDLGDILRSVLAELKIPLTDTVEVARIKQDINDIYLNEVAPFKRWLWLRKKSHLELKPFYGSSALTATVTPDSTTVTLSTVIPSAQGSKAGYYFATDNYSELYYIEAHTAGTATLTLSSPWTGSASSTATFKIWKDWVALPTNCRETFHVSHRFQTQPLEAQGIQEFLSTQATNPRRQARPAIYSTDDYVDPTTTGDDETESDRYRVMRFWPSLNTASTTLEVHYIQEVTPLDLDGDEPLMPVHDRNVLKYGALSLAWARHRNEEAAARNWQQFTRKLERMAADIEDSFDKPQLVPSSKYVRQKRGSRLGWAAGTTAVSGGGANASPTYIKDAELATGNSLTGNLTVADGITIDGVDVSELAEDVSLLTTLEQGKIIVGNQSNEPEARAVTGDISMDYTGLTAISSGVIVDADVSGSAAITRSKTAVGTAYRVLANNASGVMSENAAITADSAVVSDANGQLEASATTATEIGYVAGVTSSIQDQIDAVDTLIDDHIADTVGAHAASAISVTPAGNLAADDVQEALEELQTDIDTRALDSDLDAHIADTTAAHAASAVSVTPTGNLAADDVQEALEEIQADVDTRLTDASTATLTNKTFDADGTGNSISNIENADIKVGAAIARSKLASGSNYRVVTNDGSGVMTDAAAITASRAIVSDANGIPTHSSVTSTELGYVSGVTSAIQTQLNNINVDNLISAADARFESNSVGAWAGYQDAANVNPVDGTGGSVSGSLTFAATSSDPLVGTYSALLSKTGGSNLQGNGYSLSSIAIPEGYRGSNLDLSFLYSVISGTYASGDIRIRVYDETNSALITTINTNDFALPTTSTGVAQYHVVSVPTASTTAAVRLIIHQSSTTTNNYTVSFDEFKLTLAGRASNHGVSTSCGSYTNTTTSFTDVTNLSVTITASGTRPVHMRLVLEPSATSSIKLTRAGAATSADGAVQFLRGATNIGIQDVSAAGNTTGAVYEAFPVNGFGTTDFTVSAGTHTYKVQARVVNGSSTETIAVTNCRFAVWEG